MSRLKIALVMAMEEEASGVIAAFKLESFVPDERYAQFPFRFFRGRVGEVELTLTLPGRDSRFGRDNIGTEPAAVAAFATVREFAPDLLINAGTCGSFASAGAAIGKVYLSRSHFFFHDHRIPLPGWEEYGKGAYPSLDVQNLAATLGLETANVSSGNSLDYTEQELATLKASGAILKEMEVGGIAWVAFVTKVPLFAMKSVTNLIDTNPDSPSEFEKNFASATTSLGRKLIELLRALSDMHRSTDLKTALARGKL